MKQRIIFILLTMMAIVSLLSFRLQAGNHAPHFLVKKEVMTDAYFQIYTTRFDYDPQGRIIRSEAQNPDTLIITTSYTAHGMVSVTHNSASPRYDTVRYTMNDEGMAQTDNLGNIFEYNVEGKLVKGAEGEVYTWHDGDMMTRTYTATNGVHIVKYKYTTIPDSRDFGDYIWGTACTHLVETVTDSPQITTHRYIIDSQGRVITDSSGTSVYHYTY